MLLQWQAEYRSKQPSDYHFSIKYGGSEIQNSNTKTSYFEFFEVLELFEAAYYHKGKKLL